MSIWVKPNGNEIEINDEDATIKYAESLSWTKKGEPKKRGRKPKDSA